MSLLLSEDKLVTWMDLFSFNLGNLLLNRRAGQLAAFQPLIIVVVLIGNQTGIYSLDSIISPLGTLVLLGYLLIMIAASPIWLKNRRFYTPEVKDMKCHSCGPGYYRTVLARCDNCDSEWKAGKVDK